MIIIKNIRKNIFNKNEKCMDLNTQKVDQQGRDSTKAKVLNKPL